jgi:hypothetical protein
MIKTMTERDIRAIHTLYYFHRYLPASIARLYGISRQHVKEILDIKQNETVIAETECQLCSADECQPYFIDGDKTNKRPQNIIQLCEPDLRRFQHMQLRKRNGLLTAQLSNN